MPQFHVIAGADATPVHPTIRKIGLADLKHALARGLDDFSAIPTHAIFLCLIYPVIGIVLAAIMLGYNVLPLIFPIIAGFALLGPVAAVHLYELSRRREAGLDVAWGNAFDVLHSPSFPAIAAIGAVLFVLFLAWIATAQVLYQSLFGVLRPESMESFISEIFTTPTGWTLIAIGNAIGLVFAVVAFTLSVVTFPLLLDRDIGAAEAVATSVRAVAANPITMAVWGVIVAALLGVGFLTLFVGLAVIIPVLGHATWHLYRRVVEPAPGAPTEFRRAPKGHRYAAQFPASLFASERRDQAE
jgi:uncharacterized membrane protein